jgi:hypothetical protein
LTIQTEYSQLLIVRGQGNEVHRGAVGQGAGLAFCRQGLLRDGRTLRPCEGLRTVIDHDCDVCHTFSWRLGYGWGKMVFGAVVEGGYWALGMQRLFTLYYSTLVRLDVGKYSEMESF